MKRVHILIHYAKYKSIDNTNIVGAYSSAKKVNEAYKNIIDNYRQSSRFLRGCEKENGSYVLETEDAMHYFYIKVKELQ